MDHTESQWLPKALYDSTKILAPIEPHGRLGKIFQTLRTKEMCIQPSQEELVVREEEPVK